MNNNNIKNIVITIAIILGFVVIYLLIRMVTTDNSLQYDEYLKNYKVNEYISTYISDEDMARIYLNDYIHTMYSDIEKSYNSLDKEYREKKFGSLDIYRNYVNSLNYSTYTMARYYKKESKGYTIFGVYDTNNNFYAFKTKGVMQYTVFLDDSTVEI